MKDDTQNARGRGAARLLQGRERLAPGVDLCCVKRGRIGIRRPHAISISISVPVADVGYDARALAKRMTQARLIAIAELPELAACFIMHLRNDAMRVKETQQRFSEDGVLRLPVCNQISPFVSELLGTEVSGGAIQTRTTPPFL